MTSKRSLTNASRPLCLGVTAVSSGSIAERPAPSYCAYSASYSCTPEAHKVILVFILTCQLTFVIFTTAAVRREASLDAVTASRRLRTCEPCEELSCSSADIHGAKASSTGLWGKQ